MSLQYLARRAALVVVDVQRDFCPGGSLAIPDADAAIGVINRIAPGFAYTAATMDWHPANHISFAPGHAGKKPFDTIWARGLRQTLWPDHCVQGTPGAEFHPRLDTRPFSAVIRKGQNPEMDSYSAFFENDRRTPSGLEYLLRGLGYGRVFFCGLATDVCVFYSARDALRLGFETYLIEDASRGTSQKSGGQALNKLKKRGVRIVTSKEIMP
jgi:nicotinamidase/pyrazinamidase